MKNLRLEGTQTSETYFPQVGDWMYEIRFRCLVRGFQGAIVTVTSREEDDKTSCGEWVERKKGLTLEDDLTP